MSQAVATPVGDLWYLSGCHTMPWLAMSVSNTLVEAVCAADVLHRALRSLATAFGCEASPVPAPAPTHRPRSLPLPAARPAVAARPVPGSLSLKDCKPSRK